MKKILRLFSWFLFGIFLSFCLSIILLASYQESFIFHPDPLAMDKKFNFPDQFQEIYLDNGKNLIHGLYFPHPQAKGAILFLHGNSQNVAAWANYAHKFHELSYDFYIFDYRSYGKSTGKISSEDNLYQDCNLMFEHVLKKFSKEQITVVGYSIGTGLAAHLANKYQAKNAILFAPYFSLENLIKEKAPFMPSWLIRYRIPTYKFLSQANKSKITIFHGTEDNLIPYQHSQKLAKYLKDTDQVIFVSGEHNNLLELPEIWTNLQKLL